MNILSIRRNNPTTGIGGLPGRTDDVVGRMYVNGADLCQTIENTRFLVPFGVFPLERHDSERHPNTLHIMIPHWSNILIHRGSIPPNSKGCPLVPKAVEAWLRDHVLAEIDRGEKWWCLIHEPPKS